MKKPIATIDNVRIASGRPLLFSLSPEPRMFLTDDLLLNYKRCQRRAFLEKYGDRQGKLEDSDFLQKLRRENHKHTEEVLTHYEYSTLRSPRGDYGARGEETLALMRQGVKAIFQGVLWQRGLQGWADLSRNLNPAIANDLILVGKPTLLVRQDIPSHLGNWSYIPIAVKLGLKPKPEYKLISAFHGQLLANLQGNLPAQPQLILRHRQTYHVDLEIWWEKMQEIVTEWITMLVEKREPELFISRQRCQLCNWHNACYAIAKKESHLSLIPGVTPNRYHFLQKIGIKTAQGLVLANQWQLGKEMGTNNAIYLQEQALAIVQNQPVLRQKYYRYRRHHRLPVADVELFFDLEAEPELNLDYLLGVWVVERSPQRQYFRAFVAESPEEEGRAWQDFLEFVQQYPQAPIFHYSEYELETVKRLGKLYHTPKDLTRSLCDRLEDIHQWVVKTVALPVENYSLKTLANSLGFQWREQGVSGEQTVYWYEQWLKTGDRQFLEMILSYNEDDCRATYHLKAWLEDFLPQDSQRSL